MLWAGVLLLAATLGFVPLASLLLGGRRPLAPHRTVSAGVAAGGMAAGAAVAALVLAAVPGLGGLVPIAVGGYLAAFLAVFGLVCLAVASRTSLGGGDADGPAGPARSRWATAAASLALSAYVVATFLAVGHATWVDAGFAGGRKARGPRARRCARSPTSSARSCWPAGPGAAAGSRWSPCPGRSWSSGCWPRCCCSGRPGS